MIVRHVLYLPQSGNNDKRHTSELQVKADKRFTAPTPAPAPFPPEHVWGHIISVCFLCGGCFSLSSVHRQDSHEWCLFKLEPDTKQATALSSHSNQQNLSPFWSIRFWFCSILEFYNSITFNVPVAIVTLSIECSFLKILITAVWIIHLKGY